MAAGGGGADLAWEEPAEREAVRQKAFEQLVFAGEGHGLEKNPWHGRIKAREELKWLEKYVGQ